MPKAQENSLFRNIRPIDGYLVLDEKEVVACYRLTPTLNPLTAHTLDLQQAEARFKVAIDSLRPGEHAQIVTECRRYSPDADIEAMQAQTADNAADGFRTFYPGMLGRHIASYCDLNMVPAFEYYVFFTYRPGSLLPGMDAPSLDHVRSEVARRAQSFVRSLGDSKLAVEMMTIHEIVDYLDRTLNPDRLTALPAEALTATRLTPFDPTSSELLYRTPIQDAVPRSDRTYTFMLMARTYIKSTTFKRATLPDGGIEGAVGSLLFVQRPFRLSVHLQGCAPESARSMIEQRKAQAAGAVLFAAGRNSQIQEEKNNEFDELLRATGRNDIRWVRCNVFLSVFEHSEEEVHKSMAEIAPTFTALVPDPGIYRQVDLWRSGLPFCEDFNDDPLLAQTHAVSKLFPFFELRTTSPEGGLLLGYSPANQPCFFDPWSKGVQNGNVFVTGQAGSGKSYLINNILNRLGPRGLDVSIIDKAKSYRNTCMAQDGDYIELDLQGKQSVNVWDVMDFDSKLEDDGLNDIDVKGEVKPDKVEQVAGCAEILLAEDGSSLPKLDRSLVLDAIVSTYRRCLKVKSGVVDPASVPTFSDLAETLKADLKGKDEEFQRIRKELLQKLTIVTEGTLAGLANRRTTLQVNSRFRVFDISSLPDNPAILGTAVYLLAGWLYRHWRRNKVKGVRQVAVIDEMYFFMQFASGRTLLDNLARRSRHLGLMPFFATQQLTDVLPYEECRSILNNCQTQFLFRQERNVIEAIAGVLKLTDNECSQLEALKQVRGVYSSCFFVYGSIGRNVLTIRPDPVTRWLNTTEPTHDIPAINEALARSRGNIWAAVKDLIESGN